MNNRFDDHKLRAMRSAVELMTHLSQWLADVEATAQRVGEDNLEDDVCFTYASVVVLHDEVAGIRDRIVQTLKPNILG